MLRATGLPQTSGTFPASERIGSMVNLRDMYEYVGLAATVRRAPTPAPVVAAGIPFLSVNGVRIPLELGSARRTNNRDKAERALSGSPLTSRFRTKESFTFKTVPLSKQEAGMVNTLFLGKGEGCDYALYDLYTAKGLRELSGAAYGSNYGYWGGQMLNPGIHPVYNTTDVAAWGSGTFHMSFSIERKTLSAPGGVLACFYGEKLSNGSCAPYSEIQVIDGVIRLYNQGAVGGTSMELPLSGVEIEGVNRLAVTWGDGPTQLCVNGKHAFNGMDNKGRNPFAQRVALGERWDNDSDTRGTWADGLRPYNHRVGPWGLWPCEVESDDLVRITRAAATHPLPTPYLQAFGPLISVDNSTMKCEGRVTGIEYVHADQVQLTLELDQI